ncbi:MAG: phosphoenolpyruvate carboxykinase (ATP), partial [Candidatus Micrarchaeota archaeon]
MFRKAIDEMERNVKIIDNPSFEALRKLCETEGVTTTYGSMAFRTKVKGRSAKLTEIIEGTCSKEHDRLLNKVVEYLKGKKLIKIDRRMCNKKPFHCRAYISASYPHIAYMWTRMLFDIKKKNTKPDFISVQIPEWPKTKIIADAQSGVTFILGSDYTGEMKKANLRMAMYRTKQRGGLGLHAGSKL